MLEKFIREKAPHGSGIDYDYSNIKVGNGYISFENAYHCMDENGFYDGIIPFRVKVYDDLKVDISFLSLLPAGWYRVKKYGLREYLLDLYSDWTERYLS